MPPDLPPSRSYADAVRGMANVPFLKTIKFQDQQYRANWEGAHPDLVDFHRAFHARMIKLRVPMFAVEVLRTGERQKELQEGGYSKAPPGKSPHQYSCAMDYVHSVQAWNLTKAEWQIIGHVGKEVATQGGWHITWGGDWDFWDPAHWEITPWRYVKKAMDEAEQDDGEILTAAQVVRDWRETLTRMKALIDDPSSSPAVVGQAVNQRKLIKLWLGQ